MKLNIEILKYIPKILHIITIPISLISCFITIFVALIQLRKESFRKGFFKVVFALVINETFINIFICIKSIFCLLEDFVFSRSNKEIHNKFFDNFYIQIVFLFLFISLVNILICYNIRIVYFLQKQTTEKDPMIEKDLNDDSISLKLYPHSFQKIHNFGLYTGFFTSIVLFLVVLQYHQIIWETLFDIFESDDKLLTEKINKKAAIIIETIMVLVNFISCFSCFKYYIKSRCNKENISTKIYLKSYAFYTFVYSFYWLSFHIVCYVKMMMDILTKTIPEQYRYILLSSLQIILLLVLFTNSIYRWKCYFVQTVFSSNSCCNKISQFFSIIFCCHKPHGGTIVDYNSMFIMHSLATYSDFVENEGDVNSADVHSMFEDEQSSQIY